MRAVPPIALKEAGIPFDRVKVDLKAKKLEDGSDYNAINLKMPVLGLDSGDLLTEGAVIAQMIADSATQKNLANGSSERNKLQEWLNFIASKLHKEFQPAVPAGSVDC